MFFKTSLPLTLIICVACLLAARALPAADFPPQDHGGNHLILMEGDRIWGTHTGVKDFIVTGNIDIFHYDDDFTTGAGMLEIYAENIEIEGTLDLVGAGYTGGGGGAGEGDLKGTYGKRKYHERNGSSCNNSLCPDGPATRLENGGDGGYNELAINTDNTTDFTLLMGSGGGPGLGGDIFGPLEFNLGGGGGGGGGGSGGGKVYLSATESIAISGSILTKGTTGQNGTDGTPSKGCIGPITCTPGDGGHGGDVLPPGEGLGGKGGDSLGFGFRPGRDGRDGGAGAGGGILLKCDTPGGLSISGLLDARGGRDQYTNGGTVKIFTPDPFQPAPGTIHAGRVYIATGPEVSGWYLY